MRMRHAAVVAGLALGLMSGAAKAATLEYSVFVPSNSGFALTGTIDTDYKAGPLSRSDILSYDLTFADTEYNNSNSTLDISGSSFLAVGNELRFSFDNSGSDVLFRMGNGNLEFYAGPVLQPFYQFAQFSPLINSINPQTSGSTLTIATSEGSVMSPVPLPASAPMFGAALLALGAVGFGVKRKKAAAA